MEISPRELRDAEIADSFRGYNRDIVDEFLERAAATIEALQERNRQLTERLQAALAQAEAAESRAAAAQAAVVAPTPPTPPAPEPVVAQEPEPEPEPEPAPMPAPVPVVAPLPQPARADAAGQFPDDLIQRTLLMAQKAADETVAEADQYALRTREEANTDAARTIAEAKAEADRIETERRADLDRTLRELEGRRMELEAGLDSLERFDSDYRARLRAAIESDLAAIERRPILAPGSRPAIAALAVDAIEAVDQPGALDAGPATEDFPAMEISTDVDAQVDLAVDDGDDDALEAVVIAESVPEVVTADEESSDVPPAPQPEASLLGADALDDDAFFASLREAVHDDAPLGALERDEELFPKE